MIYCAYSFHPRFRKIISPSAVVTSRLAIVPWASWHSSDERWSINNDSGKQIAGTSSSEPIHT